MQTRTSAKWIGLWLLCGGVAQAAQPHVVFESDTDAPVVEAKNFDYTPGEKNYGYLCLAGKKSPLEGEPGFKVVDCGGSSITPAKSCRSGSPTCYEVNLDQRFATLRPPNGCVAIGNDLMSICEPPTGPAGSPAPSPPPGGGAPQRTDVVGSSYADQLRAAYRDAIRLVGAEADHYDVDPQSFLERHPFKQDVAVLLYDQDGKEIAPLPLVDEGDKIAIVVVPDDDTTITRLQVTTCDTPEPVRISGLETAIPSSIKKTGATLTPVGKRYQIQIVQNCSADTPVQATITRQKTGEQSTTTQPIKFTTLALHRISVGLGVIYDFATSTSFKGAAVKGESVPVIVEDDHNMGVDVIALVALRLWRVDVKRPRQWWEIVFPSPLVGISFTDPLEHVYLGLLFEPYPGLGLVGGYDFHEKDFLGGGYQVGDRIPGGFVPVDKRWTTESSAWWVGINLDASLFVKLLNFVAK